MRIRTETDLCDRTVLERDGNTDFFITHINYPLVYETKAVVWRRVFPTPSSPSLRYVYAIFPLLQLYNWLYERGNGGVTPRSNQAQRVVLGGSGGRQTRSTFDDI